MQVNVVTTIYSHATVLITSGDTTAAKDLEQMKKDIRSVAKAFLGGTPEQRMQALRKVNAEIVSWHDSRPNAEGLDPVLQNELQKMLGEVQMAKKFRIDNTSAGSVAEFLKLFPKEEAVFVLSFYIQAYTKPRVDNDIHYSAQEFQERKVGDCSDVALYADRMFLRIGISSSVYEFVYDYLTGAHAVTYYAFGAHQGYIDNTGIHENIRGLSPKMFMHSVLPQIVNYRKIDPLLWVQTRNEKNNRAYTNDSFLSMSVTTKEHAKAICGDSIPLDMLFDNPADDVLYFKDDAGEIIKRLDISKEEREALEYFYYTSTNRVK